MCLIYNLFSQRIVNAWNKLPEDVVRPSKINEFKNALDKIVVEARGHCLETFLSHRVIHRGLLLIILRF